MEKQVSNGKMQTHFYTLPSNSSLNLLKNTIIEDRSLQE